MKIASEVSPFSLRAVPPRTSRVASCQLRGSVVSLLITLVLNRRTAAGNKKPRAAGRGSSTTDLLAVCSTWSASRSAHITTTLPGDTAPPARRPAPRYRPLLPPCTRDVQAHSAPAPPPPPRPPPPHPPP